MQDMLPALVALLETQSVTAAAQQLHVGQPAMSRTLEKLREQTGDALLVRSGRRLVRSHRAEGMLPSARALLEQTQALLEPDRVFVASAARGVVTLALGDDMQAVLASRLFSHLRDAAPGLDIRVRPLSLQTPVDLVHGRVDLVVMPDIRAEYPQLVTDEMILTPCYERRFVTVSRASRRLPLRAFVQAEHLLVSPTGEGGSYVDSALRERGLSRRVAVTVPTFQAAITILRNTDLIATLPDDLLRHLAPMLHVQKCPVPTPRLSVCVMWAARFRRDPRHTWLRETVKRVVTRAMRRA